MRIAGLGTDGVRPIEVDPVTQALRPAALRAAIEADRAAGDVPAIVVATIGTTSTTAIDPLPEIGAICAEYGIWLHVDAAYAGSAAVCPSCAGRTPASSTPTRTASIRTSGCSPASTATRSGWPTAAS
ncbi:hypothetical protein GCM10027614_24880 [Micromonospora vulcania]